MAPVETGGFPSTKREKAICYNRLVVYTYDITVPLLFQIITLEGNRPIASRAINFVVDFTSKTPITQADVTQAELALQGKPVASDTELIRCVQTIAARCVAESEPMIERLSLLSPHAPTVKAAVVLEGNIRWHKKPTRQ